MSDEEKVDETSENITKAEVAAAAEETKREPDADAPDDRATKLETEAAELKDQLLRALAETENIRKRTERQLADERVYAIEKFARDLLSVSDNLSRALEAVTDDVRAGLSEGGQGLLGGIEMTQKELHAVLSRHGVKAIDAAPGAAFDPNLHQAVSQIPSDHPSGSVAAPFQTGWRIGERTLRAAMVAVSSGPASPPVEEAPPAEGAESSSTETEDKGEG